MRMPPISNIINKKSKKSIKQMGILLVLSLSLGCTSLQDIENASVSDLRTMVKYPTFKSFRTSTGENPLLVLIARNKTPEAVWLIGQGKIDLEELTDDQYSALDYAIKYNNLHVVQALLSHGVNVDRRNLAGNTYLHTAAMQLESTDIPKRLLDQGCPVDALNGQGETPLFKAVEFGREAVARLLVEHGAKTAIIDGQGNTLLHRAVESKEPPRAVRFVLALGADLEKTNGEYLSALLLSIRSRQLEAAQLLLDAGSKIDAENPRYGSPLAYAVKMDAPAFIDLLIHSGADPRAPSASGDTLLHLAVSAKAESSLWSLVRAHRLNPDLASKNQLTPVMYAFKNGEESCGELLIELGADLRKQDSNGKSAEAYRGEYYSDEIRKNKSQRDIKVAEREKKKKLIEKLNIQMPVAVAELQRAAAAWQLAQDKMAAIESRRASAQASQKSYEEYRKSAEQRAQTYESLAASSKTPADTQRYKNEAQKAKNDATEYSLKALNASLEGLSAAIDERAFSKEYTGAQSDYLASDKALATINQQLSETTAELLQLTGGIETIDARLESLEAALKRY